ncbi:unnamed protein product [Diabrotica balteata]|uniref:Uncharacterized protein n=1 Tax=Diabrotica balteata TaxID=107213 RepID=A0A9N9SUQ4_DIABA|nr:unnamed protein product [Diabrotica balteata]
MLFLFATSKSENSIIGYQVVKKHVTKALGDATKSLLLTFKTKKTLGLFLKFSIYKRLSWNSWHHLWTIRKNTRRVLSAFK